MIRVQNNARIKEYLITISMNSLYLSPSTVTTTIEDGDLLIEQGVSE